MQSKVTIFEELDGISQRFTVNSIDYILLLKHIENKPYLILYITDALDNFWIERQDLQYFQKIANQVNLQADLKTFIKLISTALQTDCILNFTQSEAVLTLRLRIGDSVTIHHIVKAGIKVGRQNRPEEFRKLNRTFIMHFFQVKHKQNKQNANQLQLNQTQIRSKEVETAHRSPQNFNPKVEQRKLIKKGNMVNPNLKKRKSEGVKFKNVSEYANSHRIN